MKTFFILITITLSSMSFAEDEVRRIQMPVPKAAILTLLPPGQYEGLNKKNRPCMVEVQEDATVRISPSDTNVGSEDAVYFRHAHQVVSAVSALQSSHLQVQTKANQCEGERCDEYSGNLDVRPYGADSLLVSATAQEFITGSNEVLNTSGQCQLKAM